MEQRTSLTEIIEYINPGDLNYQEWINVGMALKQEGYSMDCWDAWSRRDSGRYHAGECAKKWKSFSGSSSPGPSYRWHWIMDGFRNEAMNWNGMT